MNGSLLSGSTIREVLWLIYVNEEHCVLLNIQQKISLLPFYLRSQRSFHIVWSLKKMADLSVGEAEPEVVTKTEASALTDLMTLEDGRLKLPWI